MLQAPYVCWPYSFQKDPSYSEGTRLEHFKTHLEQLTDAAEKGQCGVLHYKLHKAPLNHELFVKLLDALIHSNIQSLDISGNLISAEHHSLLIDFVEHHPTLVKLNISSTAIDKRSIQQWSNFVSSNLSVRELKISSTLLRKGEHHQVRNTLMCDNVTIESYEDGTPLDERLIEHLKANKALNALSDFMDSFENMDSVTGEVVQSKKNNFNQLWAQVELTKQHHTMHYNECKSILLHQFNFAYAEKCFDLGLVNEALSHLEHVANSKWAENLLPSLYAQANFKLGEFYYAQAPSKTLLDDASTLQEKIIIAKSRSDIFNTAVAFFEAAELHLRESGIEPHQWLLANQVKRTSAEANIIHGELVLDLQDNECPSPFKRLIRPKGKSSRKVENDATVRLALDEQSGEQELLSATPAKLPSFELSAQEGQNHVNPSSPNSVLEQSTKKKFR